jgi:hypothetical protein
MLEKTYTGICACHHWKGKQTLPTGNM